MTPERRTLLREKIAVVKPRRWETRMMGGEMAEFAELLAELAEELLEARDRETPEDASLERRAWNAARNRYELRPSTNLASRDTGEFQGKNISSAEAKRLYDAQLEGETPDPQPAHDRRVAVATVVSFVAGAAAVLATWWLS